MLVVVCKEEENFQRETVPQHYADVHRAAVFALPEAVEGLVRQRDPAEIRVMEEQVRESPAREESDVLSAKAIFSRTLVSIMPHAEACPRSEPFQYAFSHGRK